MSAAPPNLVLALQQLPFATQATVTTGNTQTMQHQQPQQTAAMPGIPSLSVTTSMPQQHTQAQHVQQGPVYAGPVAGRQGAPGHVSPTGKTGPPFRGPPQLAAAAAGAGGARKVCNCKNSRCLKLYCECFASGKYCDNCNCNNCLNNTENEATRQGAVEGILERNPNAFRPKITQDHVTDPTTARQPAADPTVGRHLKGCNCKKSNCLKKYCECFQGNIYCGQLCKCIECKNYDGSEMRLQAVANQELAQNAASGAHPSPAKRMRPMTTARVPVPPVVQGTLPATSAAQTARVEYAQQTGNANVQQLQATSLALLQRTNLHQVVNEMVQHKVIDELCRLLFLVADECQEEVTKKLKTSHSVITEPSKKSEKVEANLPSGSFSNEVVIKKEEEGDPMDVDDAQPNGNGEAEDVGKALEVAIAIAAELDDSNAVYEAQEKAVLEEFLSFLQKVIDTANKKSQVTLMPISPKPAPTIQPPAKPPTMPLQQATMQSQPQATMQQQMQPHPAPKPLQTATQISGPAALPVHNNNAVTTSTAPPTTSAINANYTSLPTKPPNPPQPSTVASPPSNPPMTAATASAQALSLSQPPQPTYIQQPPNINATYQPGTNSSTNPGHHAGSNSQPDTSHQAGTKSLQQATTVQQTNALQQASSLQQSTSVQQNSIPASNAAPTAAPSKAPTPPPPASQLPQVSPSTASAPSPQPGPGNAPRGPQMQPPASSAPLQTQPQPPQPSHNPIARHAVPSGTSAPSQPAHSRPLTSAAIHPAMTPQPTLMTSSQSAPNSTLRPPATGQSMPPPPSSAAVITASAALIQGMLPTSQPLQLTRSLPATQPTLTIASIAHSQPQQLQPQSMAGTYQPAVNVPVASIPGLVAIAVSQPLTVAVPAARTTQQLSNSSQLQQAQRTMSLGTTAMYSQGAPSQQTGPSIYAQMPIPQQTHQQTANIPYLSSQQVKTSNMTGSVQLQPQQLSSNVLQLSTTPHHIVSASNGSSASRTLPQQVHVSSTYSHTQQPTFNSQLSNLQTQQNAQQLKPSSGVAVTVQQVSQQQLGNIMQQQGRTQQQPTIMTVHVPVIAGQLPSASSQMASMQQPSGSANVLQLGGRLQSSSMVQQQAGARQQSSFLAGSSKPQQAAVIVHSSGSKPQHAPLIAHPASKPMPTIIAVPPGTNKQTHPAMNVQPSSNTQHVSYQPSQPRTLVVHQPAGTSKHVSQQGVLQHGMTSQGGTQSSSHPSLQHAKPLQHTHPTTQQTHVTVPTICIPSGSQQTHKQHTATLPATICVPAGTQHSHGHGSTQQRQSMTTTHTAQHGQQQPAAVNRTQSMGQLAQPRQHPQQHQQPAPTLVLHTVGGTKQQMIGPSSNGHFAAPHR